MLTFCPDSNTFHKSSASPVVHFCVKMFPLLYISLGYIGVLDLKKKKNVDEQNVHSYYCLLTDVVVNDHIEVREGAWDNTFLLELLTLTPFKDLFATAKGYSKASLEKRDAPVSHSFLFFQNVVANESSGKGHFQTVPDMGLLTEKRN